MDAKTIVLEYTCTCGNFVHVQLGDLRGSFAQAVSCGKCKQLLHVQIQADAADKNSPPNMADRRLIGYPDKNLKAGESPPEK